MKPAPYRIPNAEDVVPLSEYLQPCMRWAFVWFGLARRARVPGRWDIGAKFQAIGEAIFDRMEAMK